MTKDLLVNEDVLRQRSHILKSKSDTSLTLKAKKGNVMKKKKEKIVKEKMEKKEERHINRGGNLATALGHLPELRTTLPDGFPGRHGFGPTHKQ